MYLTKYVLCIHMHIKILYYMHGKYNASTRSGGILQVSATLLQVDSINTATHIHAYGTY